MVTESFSGNVLAVLFGGGSGLTALFGGGGWRRWLEAAVEAAAVEAAVVGTAMTAERAP